MIIKNVVEKKIWPRSFCCFQHLYWWTLFCGQGFVLYIFVLLILILSRVVLNRTTICCVDRRVSINGIFRYIISNNRSAPYILPTGVFNFRSSNLKKLLKFQSYELATESIKNGCSLQAFLCRVSVYTALAHFVDLIK